MGSSFFRYMYLDLNNEDPCLDGLLDVNQHEINGIFGLKIRPPGSIKWRPSYTLLDVLNWCKIIEYLFVDEAGCRWEENPHWFDRSIKKSLFVFFGLHVGILRSKVWGLKSKVLGLRSFFCRHPLPESKIYLPWAIRPGVYTHST